MTDDAQTSGYVPRRLRRKPRKVVRVILLSALMLVVTVVGVGGAYASKLQQAFASATVIEKTDILPTYEGQPFKDPGDGSRNILLLGADKSEDGKALDLTAKGTTQRSDSMMLVHIPENRKGIYVMSIMRDTYVQIPDGHGYAKINAAMQFGGVPLLRKTIESMMDVHIDNVAALDFNSFKGLTKAIGGVTVDNPIDWCTDSGKEYCFKKGKEQIEGQRALRWVRERHAFLTGDYQRVKNQQEFVKQVFKKLMSSEVMGNPNKIADVAKQVMPFVSMDSELGDQQVLIGLAMQMTSLRANDIHSFTLPNAGTGNIGGQSVVLNSTDWNRKLGKAMKGDSMEALYKSVPAEFKGD